MDFDPSKDYYKSLGLSETATQDDIKKAFRKLAVQHHPDKAGGDKAKFQEINEAHGVLSDEKKRSQYDMYRKWWGGMGGFGWWGFWWFGGAGGGFEVDLGDVMDQFFGGGGRWGSRWWWPQPGEDVQVGLEISFEESYMWVSKTIQYSRKVKVEWAQEEQCPTCKGSGRVVQQSQTIFGMMQTQNVCPTCAGSGTLYTKAGKRVPGWLETMTEKVDANVPAGVKEGVYIRYTGKWDVWQGWGSAWDLYVQIKVKGSSIYKRHGDDLYVSVEVSIFDLVLGREVKVSHPSGTMTVKIPKWTQVTDKIRVTKKWFGDKGLFAKMWDMYIIPKLSIPKKLSKEEDQLRNNLAQLEK